MIELIHCHIPKTGGVSFLQVIEQVYGKDTIAFPWTWLGMAPEQGKGFNMMWKNWPELKRIWKINIPRIASENEKLKVLQGHHPVGLYKDMFPRAKRIAWVRHPIDRVVSNWHHDMKNGYQPYMPLEEYAEKPYNRNVMSFYVGHDINNMDWIGVLEMIDRDMINLATLLRWKDIPNVPHLNKSNRKTSFRNIGKKIADLNMQDMEIFAQVLARKQEHTWIKAK